MPAFPSVEGLLDMNVNRRVCYVNGPQTKVATVALVSVSAQVLLKALLSHSYTNLACTAARRKAMNAWTFEERGRLLGTSEEVVLISRPPFIGQLNTARYGKAEDCLYPASCPGVV